ncbi:hypothetical protein SPRG_05847 [Saprolegnia parasitica CBS 223.65]|uniref:Dolichyl-diphosphooligosaccharide--protein glycosyltransferase subunit 3 n=1 Tax=Saprolegnia parasitica (strain CBS 223.65) TaxID=695850 RepID=A0A067CJF5_SAPPC|nr:hypothetical protein SPRG_05847 [Saprolegnia parasitica CBS 223.65]KDO29310.1 hypothetical protein SPRG_05847 [Saprolegnia parasitica CBS 223.65]|eukprot:XP_012199817.1 hypothetical protein SPRG_05847 [Saprolegnia parasitica CBS 223.65]
MGGFLRPLMVALLALAVTCMALGQESLHEVDFLEDYFYVEDVDVVVQTAPVPEGLPAGRIELTHDHLQPYMDLIVSAKRTRHVLVFLSTSHEARDSFVRAVRALQHRDEVDMYFFAVPLVASDDAFEITFKDAHKLSSIPDDGLHILATFEPNARYGLQIGRENARLVDPSVLTPSTWTEKLSGVVQEMLAPPVVVKPSDSSLSSLFLYGALAYLAFVLLPRLYTNRASILPVVTRRSTWFLLCVFVMYLSLSGTFFTIIHGSPLFYFNANGFSLMHPSSQRQFALEGWTLGGMPLAVSLVLVAVSEAMPFILGPDNRFHAATMLLLAFAFLCFFEHVLFTTKNRWYRLF